MLSDAETSTYSAWSAGKLAWQDILVEHWPTGSRNRQLLLDHGLLTFGDVDALPDSALQLICGTPGVRFTRRMIGALKRNRR